MDEVAGLTNMLDVVAVTQTSGIQGWQSVCPHWLDPQHYYNNQHNQQKNRSCELAVWSEASNRNTSKRNLVNGNVAGEIHEQSQQPHQPQSSQHPQSPTNKQSETQSDSSNEKIHLNNTDNFKLKEEKDSASKVRNHMNVLIVVRDSATLVV
ncbi:hypothetical protein Pcinc_011760 [Petrolisthes cinctipes]|uniref:Uncharacterized protein n=1 Tax=Petrolisthes cinctipes TaxID=88211 RepID=A0AAE1G663_PETCI|nr:hypothetical protein Pcinc_011760 [Petrolisthes cinctipes]